MMIALNELNYKTLVPKQTPRNNYMSFCINQYHEKEP